MRNRAGYFGSRDGNCFLYGCGAAVLLGIGGVIITAVILKRAFDEFKENFTADSAVVLPRVDDNPDTIARLDEWRKVIESDGEASALTLTQDDLNVLIQHHPDFEALKESVYVTIEGDTVKGDMSFPLDAIPGFSGRYFNGSATFDVSLEDDRVYLYVLGASVKGEEVPEEGLAGVRTTNLAEDFNRDPNMQEALEHVESITVKDGTVTIVPKNAVSGSDEAPAEEESGVDEEAVEPERQVV